MKRLTAIAVALVCALTLVSEIPAAGPAPVSDATRECLDCHAVQHPGIATDWQGSRHAHTTPAEALKAPELSRKVSTADVPGALREASVGCAECHTLRAGKHADDFEHNGYTVHVVVTPDDCAVCHAVESRQYAENKMSRAYGNLANNRVYDMLEKSILGTVERKNGRLSTAPADDATRAEACYHCHGTKLSVTGSESRETELAGELSFPVIQGWPNQGVGRVNPDGGIGACTPCHTRHRFSMETARKPHTCGECHVGPDVPVYKVYKASKHGNLFDSHGADWDFSKTPWTVGRDFTAPTCAACHVSLVTDADGNVVSERTHRMNDRLPWRLFGLYYSHPQPENPDTTVLRNPAGNPLPTDINGNLAPTGLIQAEEQQARAARLTALCLKCHDTSWVNGFWNRFENTLKTTDHTTKVAAGIVQDVWKEKLADPKDPFDEAPERIFADLWLFYANTVRFSSAMGYGGDYGVFADGRYQMARTIRDLDDWRFVHKSLKQKQ